MWTHSRQERPLPGGSSVGEEGWESLIWASSSSLCCKSRDRCTSSPVIKGRSTREFSPAGPWKRPVLVRICTKWQEYKRSRVIDQHLLSIEELSSKQDEFVLLRVGTERCIKAGNTNHSDISGKERSSTLFSVPTSPSASAKNTGSVTVVMEEDMESL